MKASEFVMIGVGSIVVLFLIWVFSISLYVGWLFLALVIGVLLLIIWAFDMEKHDNAVWEEKMSKYHKAKEGSKWDFKEFHK